MFNKKVIVKTNKGKGYYGILLECEPKEASATLRETVSLDGYTAGDYERLKSEKVLILDVESIGLCSEKMIRIIETGIDE